MITPSGSVEPSKKKGNIAPSKKQKARADKGRERAVELSGRLEEKVKGREERKVSFVFIEGGVGRLIWM
jgi:hypothetical protein